MFDRATKSFSASWLAMLALTMLLGRLAEGSQTLTLAWNPSQAANVAGYDIYYGNDGTNFQYIIDAGTNTSYEISGLQEGHTNTFAVTAYDDLGIDSAPSNLISYIVPGLLTVAPIAGPGSPALISFPVAPGLTYQLQASVDLTTWSIIWQTTAASNAWTQVQDLQAANFNMRFYRVASQ